ncbi:MAG TPA: glycosyltransferase [Streptosporangiaceae bacterium]|nr:glycosyltransferase [Streptosporangiaceae bacterium]
MAWPLRRALLVPGSISTGHQTAAIACAATLEALGWKTHTLDASWLNGQGWGPAAETTFRAMLAVPGLYDAFHYTSLRTGNRLALQADAITRYKLVPRLRDYLDRHPVQLVISISPTGASAVSSVAARYPAMRHVVFCTDAVPHRLWVHDNVDLYLVTAVAAEPAVHRFQPEAKVIVIPPAVRPEFYRAPTQRSARIGLSITESDQCVLLIGGSRGLGPLAEIADALASAGLAVLAVAGYNPRLERKLRAVSERRPKVQVFGFTDRMPELMAACDLVITSPGGTCMEARTVGRPLLLLDLVQGHGRDNLQHELAFGDAAVTSRMPLDVARATLAYLQRIKPPPVEPTRSLADWEERLRLALESIAT